MEDAGMKELKPQRVNGNGPDLLGLCWPVEELELVL
jgi:hypothetical protein